MLARRFLIFVFILTLLAVAGAFAIFQFGQDILIRTATPTVPFQAPRASEGPDYARIENWIDRPGIPQGPASWRPEGDAAPASAPSPAYAFYIHPTTYLAADRWNAPAVGNRESDDRASLFVRSQASALAGSAQVWAPRYRQAAYGAFLLDSADAQAALDLAYGDVRRAFDHFLAGIPADAPVILAGHSQGSLHLLRLLRDVGPRLKSRLVAAYVVGWPVGIRSDLPATGLAACADPADTGCVLSWQSFAEPANPRLVLQAWEGSRGFSSVRQRSDMLCTNPLTGRQGGEAPPSANPGTLLPNGDLSSATLAAGLVGARCESGFLNLVGEAPQMGPFVLPGNNYHVYDYALFWKAVSEDVRRRLSAWTAR